MTAASMTAPGIQRRSNACAASKAHQIRALCYEWVRQGMVAEVCADGVGLAVRTAQVATMLAFAADIGVTPGRVFELPDRVSADWVVGMLAAPRQVRLGWPDGARPDGAAWVKVDDPVRVLSRFGYRGSRGWAFEALGGDSATGVIRGALAAAGHLSREGVRIVCPSPEIAATMMTLLQRVGIAVAKPLPAGVGDVIIARTGVGAALKTLGLPGTAAAYGQLLDAELAAKAVAYTTVLVDHNAARARAAANAEADRIAALGDLDGYELPQHLRQAAQVRRDHRDLNYSQAGAVLGISKDTFTGRIRRFWLAIETLTAVSRGQIA